MKARVTDAAVDEFVAKLRAGVSTGEVFPAKMSDCDFTPAQREKIRKARADKKAAQKHSPPSVTVSPAKPAPKAQAAPKPNSPQNLSRLGKLLYLQGGTCFFCGESLLEKNASIEHLHPSSRGGTNAQDNLVVCHKTLNQAFGDMDLKRKFEFVLKTKGAFQCPGTTGTRVR